MNMEDQKFLEKKDIISIENFKESGIYWFFIQNYIEKTTKNGKPFTFYDGPPFATGTPHYGHLVASAMKDAIPRYQTMKGRFVERIQITTIIT